MTLKLNLLVLMTAQWLVASALMAEEVGEHTTKIDGQSVPVGAIGYARAGGGFRFSIKPEYSVNNLAPKFLDSSEFKNLYQQIIAPAPSSNESERQASVDSLLARFVQDSPKESFAIEGCQGYHFFYMPERRALDVFDSSLTLQKHLEGVTKVDCHESSLIVKANSHRPGEAGRQRYYFFDDEKLRANMLSYPGDDIFLVSKVVFPPSKSSLESTMVVWVGPNGKRYLYHPRGYLFSKPYLKRSVKITRDVMIFASGEGPVPYRYYFVSKTGEVLLEATEILDHMEVGPTDEEGNDNTVGYLVLAKGDFSDSEPESHDNLPEPYRSAEFDESGAALVAVSKHKQPVLLKSTSLMSLQHIFIEMQPVGAMKNYQSTALRFRKADGSIGNLTWTDGNIYMHSSDFIPVQGCEGVTIEYDAEAGQYVVLKHGLPVPLLRSAGLVDIACSKKGEIGILYYIATAAESDEAANFHRLVVFNPGGTPQGQVDFPDQEFPLTSVLPARGSWWRVHNGHFDGTSLIADIQDGSFHETKVPEGVHLSVSSNISLHALLREDLDKIGSNYPDVEQVRVAPAGEQVKYDFTRVSDSSILGLIEQKYSHGPQSLSRDEFLALLFNSEPADPIDDKFDQEFEARQVARFLDTKVQSDPYLNNSDRASPGRVYLRWDRASPNQRKWLAFGYRKIYLPGSDRTLHLTFALDVHEDLTAAEASVNRIRAPHEFSYSVEVAPR